ncbi:MAG: C39 family peptidase [Elusimicrobia bacterium]|nr:C39 family peptidase [Elusimicrobiota bacterium]
MLLQLALSLLAAAPAWAGSLAGPALPSDHLRVPLMPQSTNYSCGAAAMMAILHYWKVSDGNESSLYPLLGTTPEEGTHPAKLVAGARHHGLRAELREGLGLPDLEAALKRRETVILDIQAWQENDPTPEDWTDNWEDGHYVVLVGMDQDYLYVMDPSTHLSYGYIPRAELPGRWHDYENEGGKLREYRRMGIFISGKEPLAAFPAQLERVR